MDVATTSVLQDEVIHSPSGSASEAALLTHGDRTSLVRLSQPRAIAQTLCDELLSRITGSRQSGEAGISWGGAGSSMSRHHQHCGTRHMGHGVYTELQWRLRDSETAIRIYGSRVAVITSDLLNHLVGSALQVSHDVQGRPRCTSVSRVNSPDWTDGAWSASKPQGFCGIIPQSQWRARRTEGEKRHQSNPP